MNDKRKAAPNRDGKEWQNSNLISRHKDSKNLFAFHQRRVFNLLSDGIPRAVADISADLRLSDPRSVIRDLRNKGVNISDFWCDSAHGSRYKRYFIEPSEPHITGKEGRDDQ